MTKVNKNWLEWTVFGVGLVLVLGTIGYLLYDAATIGEPLPDLEVGVGRAELHGQDFAVPVKVTNRGQQTAEGVQVEVVLIKDGAEQERGTFEIAFVPRRAEREGWVTFKTDPRGGELRARVLGYERP